MIRALALALVVVGCDSGGEDTCVPAYEAPQCDPLYEPTFDNFHERTLVPSCAVGGGSCHAMEGSAGGLAYLDADATYRAFIDHGLVVPNQPECSPLAHRLGAGDPTTAMPPGDPLSAAEQCVAMLWIARGASR